MGAEPSVAAYVRCSTREQNDRLQRRAIRQWAKANGAARVKWFSDKASGVNLFDWLSKKGVRLVSITEGVDLTTPVGRMVAGVLATFAEFENAVRRERQMAGIRAAKAAGKRWGGSETGWSKIKPPQRKRIVQMFRSGMSKAAIGRAEGLSWPTVAKVLKQAT